MQNFLFVTRAMSKPQKIYIKRICQQTEVLAGSLAQFLLLIDHHHQLHLDGTTSIQVTQEITHEIRHEITEGE
jgi:hypothetical protein